MGMPPYTVGADNPGRPWLPLGGAVRQSLTEGGGLFTIR